MAEADTGGHAFPGAIDGVDVGEMPEHYPGMTMRDWFAGQALLLFRHSVSSDGEVAAMAYGVADAMIKERNK